jgi:hypothetical protein
MSQLQSSYQYLWLPSHLATLYDWLKFTEPSWGFTIYRTTYTPQSNASFPAIVDLITAYVKDEFYKEHEDLLENSRLRQGRTVTEDDIAVFDKMWAKYEPRVIQDAAQFDTSSIDQIRAHYEGWVEERDMADRFPDYRMFIVIDEESLQSLLNATIPEERQVGMQHRIGHYVKLVEAWQEIDPPPFLGWMKCSLPGLWDIWRNMQDGCYMKDSYVLVCKHRDVY